MRRTRLTKREREARDALKQILRAEPRLSDVELMRRVHALRPDAKPAQRLKLEHVAELAEGLRPRPVRRPSAKLKAVQQRDRERAARRAAEAERQRQGRRAALYRARDFLAAGGITVTVTGDDQLALADGRRIGGVTTAESAAGFGRWLDGLVARRFVVELGRALVAHLDARDLGLHAARGRRGWVLHRDRRPVAVVSATHAAVRDGTRVDGNFLVDGEHWAVLSLALHILPRPAPPAARPAAPKPAAVAPADRVYTAFPAGLDERLAAAAIEASRRLREERNLVFDHAVELIHADGRVRFGPLRSEPALAVPFEWRNVRGELRLKTPRDPLALLVAGDPPEADVATAWVTALLGYAELTCVETSVYEPAGEPTRRAAAPRTVRSDPPQRPGTRGAPRLSWDRLTPLPGSAAAVASYVAGHRRRLRPGQRAGAEARANAERVGIRLAATETWVRPHARGLPADAVVQLRWAAPRALTG